MGRGISQMASAPLTVCDLPSCVTLCPRMSSPVANELYLECLTCTVCLLAISEINQSIMLLRRLLPCETVVYIDQQEFIQIFSKMVLSMH